MKKAKMMITAAILLGSIFVSNCATPSFCVLGAERQGTYVADNVMYPEKNTYYRYLKKYTSAQKPVAEYPALLNEFKCSDGAKIVFGTYKTVEKTLFWENGTGALEVPVTVNKDGLYHLEIDYLTVRSDSAANPEFEMYIDGYLPFNECLQIITPKKFRDDTYKSFNDNDFETDNRGNSVCPNPVELEEWSSILVRDATGSSKEPYYFYLTKGEHIIRLVSLRNAVAISKIAFLNSEKAVSYDDYKRNSYGDKTENFLLEIEAEKTFYKSDVALYPTINKSSAATTPMNPYASEFNTFGGESWSSPLQTVAWEFNVDKDGCYKIGFRFRQNYLRGLYSSRDIKIDGKTLFSQLSDVRFDYSGDWQLKVLGDGEPFEIFLSAGTHTVTLTPTVSGLCDELSLIEDTVEELNTLFGSIVMVTGTNPDMYRDYYLDETIPGLIGQMKKCSKNIKDVSERLQEEIGNSGGMSATLDRITEQLDSFIEKPETIPTRISNFQSNISALASWVIEMRSQGLLLDKIFVVGSCDEFPNIEATFAESAVYKIKSFISSFVNDYTSIGNSYPAEKSVYIWLNGSRDVAGVIKTVIDSDFSEKTGIGVNANLTTTSLLAAIMADKGPDVAISVARSEPLNLAIRGAVEPLDEYDGFSEITKDFSSTALNPYMYRGKCYAIPVTESFLMAFYRTDIFNRLELNVPKTWSDVYALSETLQRNNMNIGIPSDLFYTLLFQMDGSLYNEKLTATALDTVTAYNAFKMWCDFYTQYGLPLFKNDYNRFRTGEEPYVIADYSLYNQLYGAAPEIRNMWKMVPIPGIQDENGKINNTSAASGTACLILKNSKNKKNSWEFLKWWADGETQGKIDVQVESMLGIIARAAPASRTAMKKIGWSNSESLSLDLQWENTRETEEIPGSYYTTRNINNAFNAVYYGGANIRQTLDNWNKETNKELERKRKEFDYAQ